MTAKKHIYLFFTLVFIYFGSIFATNVYVDPFWFFNHENSLNSLQKGFNERLQKSIYLKQNVDLDKIDTLVLGASTITYFKEKDFKPFNAFNYSVSGAKSQEYVQQTEFIQNLKGKSIDNIVLGLDFVMYQESDNENLFAFFDELSQSMFWYMYKTYINPNNFDYSEISIDRSLGKTPKHRSYDRKLITYVEKVSHKVVDERVSKKLNKFFKKVKLQEDYKNNLSQLVDSNNQSRIITFSTPLGDPFLGKIYKNRELFESYKQWLRDVVEVLGQVYFFTFPNEFSKNYLNLSNDGLHFYPEQTTHIINMVLKKQSLDTNVLLITKDNIEKSLIEIESKFQNRFN